MRGSLDRKLKPAAWDARIMAVAAQVATWSKDPDEGVGCVLVSPDRRRVCWGYNGLPQDHPDEPEALLDKDVKNQLMLHAEENALANAGCDLDGWTLYVTKAPCLHCSLVIKRHRIARVVCPPIREDSRWAQEQRVAQEQLATMGVLVVTHVED